MTVYKIDGAYAVQKIKNHKQIKSKILDLLKKEEFSSIDDGFDQINKTSWNQHSENSEWQKYFLNNCKNEIQNQYQELGYSYYEIKNLWFQEYVFGDYHGWHSHPDATFSNVYFLELPDKKMATEFISPYSKKIVKIDCSEGDLITFPAYLNHRSPRNLSNDKKTVLVFNSYASFV